MKQPMKTSFALALFGVWSVFASWSSPVAALQSQVTDAKELNLAVGENTTLSAQDVKSFSVGAGGVAEVKVTPNGTQFVIAGAAPGATTLLLIMKDGSEVLWTINVFARPVKIVEDELQELLGETTGVRVKKVGARFFIEGGVSTEADLRRIETIANLYGGQVQSLVVLGGAAADRKINIRIDFYFVQYDKTKSSQLGISWPATIGGAAITSTFAYDFLAGAMETATAAITNQPLPGLDLAARSGWAKVLKHATVIASNGTEALFTSGGVQNYQVTSGLVTAIQQINFGTEVKVLPRSPPTSRCGSVSRWCCRASAPKTNARRRPGFPA
jgi:pilus assembly protein CpaC